MNFHECNIVRRAEQSITPFLSDIEFLGISNDLIVTSYLRTFGHLLKLKSLGSPKYCQAVNLLRVLKFAHFLTNLEQLTTYCDDESYDYFVQVENQIPIFGNLLHLKLTDYSYDRSTFAKFLNLCPNLLDLSLELITNDIDQIHQINRNFNVQRLDLRFVTQDPEQILKTIEKFPNCRYLSMSAYYASLSPDELIQIIRSLPHLSLFHVKHDSKNLAEKQIVKNHCHSQNPKIDVYFGSKDGKLLMFHKLYRKFQNHFYINEV
ncbi:uncharacterized protein LOC128394250 isoform X1 [Panonychus citri]|uniref:uncharacterized protein LOC128394250 isoform X1 n=1 Tax=Panonychus citri TaxID=50023 RepID=UPI002308292F|nr:uncharacterized protein LOC128394250 isoform X1 [Panonychus citri]XP_053210528.1 uncharacterized protein LOC128394250 isoform X1 [Panonychus citri]